MGLRFRTPIGSLREQRRKAESLLPQQSGRASTIRYRNAERTSDAAITASEFGKRENLIERLRSVLASDRTSGEESLSEYEVLQDELSRISQHQQANRGDASNPLADLSVPRTMYFDSAAPFRYVIIDGGNNSSEFADLIPKLTSAPSNLDSYLKNVRNFDEPIPRSMPLTLLLSPDAETPKARVKSDPSHDAAHLTQNKVTESTPSKERSLLPKSLVLSLLGDK